jgi:glycosyltransferase involved in cell wall biosynthesis
MNDVTIIIATFGGSEWAKKAEKATASARNQTVPAQVIPLHAQSLAQARNSAAFMASTEWLIFCDADDTLAPDYVEKMLEGDDGTTLRQPSTIGVYPDGTRDAEPVLIPARDLRQSNYLVIGSMCKREDFVAAGGFDDSLPVLEDWDLWLRLWKEHGAIIGQRREAIYEVGVYPDSRNQNTKLHHNYYNQIRRRYA